MGPAAFATSALTAALGTFAAALAAATALATAAAALATTCPTTASGRRGQQFRCGRFAEMRRGRAGLGRDHRGSARLANGRLEGEGEGEVERRSRGGRQLKAYDQGRHRRLCLGQRSCGRLRHGRSSRLGRVARGGGGGGLRASTCRPLGGIRALPRASTWAAGMGSRDGVVVSALRGDAQGEEPATARCCEHAGACRCLPLTAPSGRPSSSSDSSDPPVRRCAIACDGAGCGPGDKRARGREWCRPGSGAATAAVLLTPYHPSPRQLVPTPDPYPKPPPPSRAPRRRYRRRPAPPSPPPT